MKKKVFLIFTVVLFSLFFTAALHAIWCDQVPQCGGQAGCRELSGMSGCNMECKGGGTALCFFEYL